MIYRSLNISKDLYLVWNSTKKEKNKISEYCRLSAMKKLNLLQFNFDFYMKKIASQREEKIDFLI